MNIPSFLRPLLAAVVMASAAQAAEPVELFDGKTLDGWIQYGGKAPYVVEDGAIVGTFVPGKLNSFLATNKDYGDFVLELDIKCDEGEHANSGVQIRSHHKSPEESNRVYGYQVEFDPKDPTKCGGIYEEAGRGWINDIRKTDAGAKVAAAFKHNDWNHYKIEAKGDHIRTWINGVPATDFHDDKEAKGFIALQVHNVPTAEKNQVRFKNIRITELE